jgi:hypothetical protein
MNLLTTFVDAGLMYASGPVTSPVTNKDYISFQVRLPPIHNGNHFPLRGCYFANQNLALEDGTIEEWADMVAWFLTLRPAGSPTNRMPAGDGAYSHPLAQHFIA